MTDTDPSPPLVVPRRSRGAAPRHAYVPAPPHVAGLLARVEAPSGSAFGGDMRGFAPSRRLNQGPTSTCVGHAVALAVATRANAIGFDLGFEMPSPDEICKLARAHDRSLFPDGAREPLVDEGTSAASAVWAIARYGLRAMHSPTSDGRYSDAEPATVNNDPAIDDLVLDAGRLIIGPYDITGTRTEKRAAVLACMAADIPVVICGWVDRAFEEWTRDRGVFVRADASDKSGGYHATCLLAARPDPTLNVVARDRNSWGDDWCDAGEIDVSMDVIDDAIELVAVDVRRVS